MKKILVIMMALFAILTGCSSNEKAKEEAPEKKEQVQPIGIIGAMDSEVKTLKSKLENVKVTKKAGLEFHAGELNGKSVVIVQSGVGKVNAALCTQILIDDFNVSTLINSGVAGGLYSELKVGDVVVSNRAVEHDMDITAFGHKKGYISDMSENGEPTYFETDKELAEKTQKVANEVLKDNKAYIGTIASGDIFVSNADLKAELIKDHDAYAAEMEGAAIAHVASVNNVPVIIIRSISDLANGEADVTYEEFEIKAAENSAEIVMNLVKQL
ncbi:5'-methylthioadenosine/adenosylhomocysteine nucleosidase [Bacillus massiliigorillae]|uniref:5'-methylthioadenosine/adenosylhomocysteine nucleosidase n=1 Tax=Bacillus massiliigorillae TaxID=1243664 RepID=UPI0003A193AF|nr:5'-methylthioadenosine/adenosylhomocysteine nucleosidase [Bacillus massiliigorillae]